MEECACCSNDLPLPCKLAPHDQADMRAGPNSAAISSESVHELRGHNSNILHTRWNSRCMDIWQVGLMMAKEQAIRHASSFKAHDIKLLPFSKKDSCTTGLVTLYQRSKYMERAVPSEI